MSLAPTTPVPAGWYPDPQGSFQQRWWNGTSWTNEFAQYRPTLNYTPAVQLAADHASPAQLQAAAQVAAAFAAARAADDAQARYSPQYGAIQTLEPVRTADDQRTLAAEPAAAVTEQPSLASAPAPQLPGEAASTPALVPSTPATGQQPSRAVNPSVFESYNPFGMIPEVRTGVRDRPVKRNTAVAFVLALVPAAVVGAAVALATSLPEFYTLFAQIVLAAVLVVALIGLAMADRRILRESGHESAAWPILAVIPPLYLALRSATVLKETGRGSPLPLALSMVVLVGIAAVFALQPSVVELVITAR